MQRTEEVVRGTGLVLWNVRYGRKRFEEDGESLAMPWVAAVEHHHHLTLRIDVTVVVFHFRHLRNI